METVIVALMTFPDETTARQIATTLVERQLAACVNLVPGATSVYRWQGKVCTEGEVAGLAKTTQARLPALKEALRQLHPYECPELVAWEAVDGLEAYLDWVGQSLGQDP